MDIPRIFTITESAHRIHDPFTPEKLATLGAALRLEPGTRVLDNRGQWGCRKTLLLWREWTKRGTVPREGGWGRDCPHFVLSP